MKAVIYGPCEIEGRIAPPPSKSDSHRAVLCASACEGVTVCRNILDAEDVASSIRAARALGAEVDVLERGDGELTIRIEGYGGEPEEPEDVIDCGNSGTTLRLTCGLAAAGGHRTILTGDKSLRSRPVGHLCASLRYLGVEAEGRGIGTEEYPPVTIRGPAKGREVPVYGHISSQFISALLLLGASIGGLKIDVVGTIKSKPYVELTVRMLSTFGVDVTEKNRRLAVDGRPRSPGVVTVERDWSSAGYVLALGAAAGKATTLGVDPKSPHPDSEIVRILKEMGARISVSDEGVTVENTGHLEGVDVNLSNSPDLVPTVAALACAAHGETTIRGVEHVRHKEVDRLAALAEELPKFGANVEELRDGLKIEGAPDSLRGAKVNPRGDHRLAMAFAVVAAVADGRTVIEDAECVAISYPRFWSDVRELGLSVRTEGEKA